MERTEVSRNQIVNQILHVGHGDLSIYTQVCQKAITVEPELFGHLIAWNYKKGEVRDSKVALPVLALTGAPDEELYENAAAHLCLLDPRNLLRAIYYYKSLPGRLGGGKYLDKAVRLYLSKREGNRTWWTQTALQHRKSLKALYALNHIKPNRFAQKVLFHREYPPNSAFSALGQLKDMDPVEAAGTILNFKIPFIVAVGALGGIKDKPDVVLALMERMSGSELITNTQMLKRYGVFENPALKAAFDQAVERMKADKKVSTLKAGRAAEAVKDEKTSKKLKQMQEERLSVLGGIEGDWLVLGDKSGSMHGAIELARQISSLIAKQVKGMVYLVFFDVSPTSYDVTGKTFDEITAFTRHIRANGGTSIGCGLDLILSRNVVVNGIAICSDGGENTYPRFPDVYTRYTQKIGMQPPVYLFHVPGEHNVLTSDCQRAGIMIEEFECGGMDFYSLPNLVKTLKTSSYALIDEIMETPLLTFNQVFKKKGE